MWKARAPWGRELPVGGSAGRWGGMQVVRRPAELPEQRPVQTDLGFGAAACQAGTGRSPPEEAAAGRGPARI